MANLNEQTSSAAKQQTSVGGGYCWLDWFMGRNENMNDGTQQEGNYTGYVADADATTTDRRAEKVSDENERSTENVVMLHPWSTVADRCKIAEMTNAVGAEIRSLPRDHCSRYVFAVDGDFEQTNNLKSNAQRMVNNGWSDCLKNWEFKTELRNIVVSENECTCADKKVKVKIYPETDSGAALQMAADNIEVIPDRNTTGPYDRIGTKYLDFEETTNVINDLKAENVRKAKELAFMKERHHVLEQRLKLTKDANMAAAQSQHAKHYRAVGQYYDGTDKSMETSTSRFNPDEWKREENMFVKKEFCMLRDNHYRMEQIIKKIDEAGLIQSLELKKIKEKLQVSTDEVSASCSNINFESEAVYKKMNNRIDKLQKTVDVLKSEKQYFIRVNEKMAKEISRNKRKHSANKKVFNKFRSQMKDLNDIKRLLNSKETAKDINNANTEILARRKYDKMKMRLSIVEKAEVTNQIKVQQIEQNVMIMSSAYLRGGAHDVPMTNFHCDAKRPQAYSPSYSPPSAILPSPTCQPALPQADPSTQYSRYTVNSDILKVMASELRKPDGDNIRKIPKRVDMHITHKVTPSAEQEIPLPPPAPPLPIIAPESPSEPPAVPELPSVAPKCSEEPLAPQPPPLPSSPPLMMPSYYID